MKLLSLLIIFIVAVNCSPPVPEQKSQFSGGREVKTETKPRKPQHTESQINIDASPVQTAQAAQQTKADSSLFPFRLVEQHDILLIKSSDHKRISVSALPSTQAISLIAGFNGLVSLKTKDGIHYLTLTSGQTNKSLHFELSEKDSTVETSDQATVTQNQILMKSTKPIVYYISSDSKIHKLCLNLKSSGLNLQVENDLPSCL